MLQIEISILVVFVSDFHSLGGSTERCACAVRVLGLLIGGYGLAHQKGGRDRKASIWLLVFVADSWGGLPENVGPNTLCRARAVPVVPVRTDRYLQLSLRSPVDAPFFPT